MADVQTNRDSLDAKLLAAIGPAASRVLEIRRGASLLGQRLEGSHADVHWTGIDIGTDSQPLSAKALAGGFDTIVVRDLIEHIDDPVQALATLSELSTDAARLICQLPNMSHISVLEQFLGGDLSYGSARPFDPTPQRLLSLASTFKLLLDGGWLPNLADHSAKGHANQAFTEAAVAASARLGIPRETALRNLMLHEMLIDCTKVPRPATDERLETDRRREPFSVIVPVNNPGQLALNVARSPGLAEVGAPVIAIANAASAAEAFAKGCAGVATRWVVYCHQDVYFPAGSGHRLAAIFATVEADAAGEELLGFAGIGLGADRSPKHAGLVIDRTHRFDHPASDSPLSIDEFALALTRDSKHQIDHTLGWHLWGTDLCLASALAGTPRRARIIRVPLFHNSYNDYSLTPAFHESARRLSAKYPQLRRIPTLCGTIEAAA
jgi:hypothetical protein